VFVQVPGSDVNGDPSHRPPHELAFAHVQPGPDVDPEGPYGAGDGGRAPDGLGRLVEHREEPVACGVHFAAAEPFELSTDQGVVLGQESTPSAILEPGGVFRRAHDVGEEHRGQNAPAPRALPHDRSVHQGESADNALFSTCYLCQVKPKSGGRTATTVAAQRAKMGV